MTWNQKITTFYNTNKGIIWLVVIALILYTVYSPTNVFTAISTGDSGRYEMMGAPKMMMGRAPQASEPAAYPEEEKRIMKTAHMNMESEKEDYERAKGGIESTVTANKGFYVSQNEYKTVYGDITYRTYAATIKVPVQAFEATLDQLKKVAELKQLTMEASDLTSQYHDTQTELATQQSLKKRVEELLKKAEKIEDIIRLEEKLSEYQQRIDNIQKQLINMERQTDYSAISVTLEEKHEIKESLYEFTGVRDLVRNIVKSLDSILVTLTTLSGWIIVALLAWGGYRIYHRKRG